MGTLFFLKKTFVEIWEKLHKDSDPSIDFKEIFTEIL
jgi:hypothetical protein